MTRTTLLSRRPATAAVAVLTAGLLTLTACGDDDGGSTETTGASSTGTETSGSATESASGSGSFNVSARGSNPMGVTTTDAPLR